MNMEKNVRMDDLDIFPKKSQLEALVQVMELDRKWMAQNLHDDICSKLNVISLNCHLLKRSDLPQQDIEEISKNIIDYSSKALSSAQKMTYDLLPPVLSKFGLHAGIRELCDQLMESGKVVIEYENNLQFDFKENDSHIHVFRILKELLTNSIQHGEATLISVLFDHIEGKRICKYWDNGIGFDKSQLQNNTGFGLRNILSRIAVLEGSISMESQINQGVSVIFNF